MFINARVSSLGFNAEEFEKAFTAADFDRCRDLVSSPQGMDAILAAARLALRERRYLDAIGMLTAATPESSVARDILLGAALGFTRDYAGGVRLIERSLANVAAPDPWYYEA